MRRMSVFGWLALSGLLLAGCWAQIGFDPGHSRFNGGENTLTAANVATLQEAWSAELLAESTEPMVRGGRAYLATASAPSETGTRDIDAVAFQSADGEVAWDTNLATWSGAPLDPFAALPAAVVGEQLWTGWSAWAFSGGRPVGLGFRSAVRLDLDDGTIMGEEANMPSSPAVEFGASVIQVRGGPTAPTGLVVRDKTTLAVQWSAPLQAVSFPGAPPTVVDEQIFVISDNRLLAFPVAGCGKATCTPQWNFDLGAGSLRTATARGGPGNRVFVTTQQGELIAVARDSGAIAWRSGPLGSTTFDAALAGDRVYVVAGTSLLAFPASGCGAATCAPVWTGSGVGGASSPTVAGGVVYAGGFGAVRAFPADGCGAATCPPLATIAVPGEVRHITVAEGKLWVVSRTPGQLTVFAPAPTR